MTVVKLIILFVYQIMSRLYQSKQNEIIPEKSHFNVRFSVFLHYEGRFEGLIALWGHIVANWKIQYFMFGCFPGGPRVLDEIIG